MSSSEGTLAQRWGIVIFAGVVLLAAGVFFLWHFGILPSGNSASSAQLPRDALPSRAERSQRIDDLQAAYEAVVAIQAATEVGVSYINYGPRLADAATALAIYEPQDDEARAVAGQLVAALELYGLAGEAWSTKFERYEYTAWSEFKDSHPELGLPANADVNTGIRFLWKAADVFMEAARLGLTDYKHP